MRVSARNGGADEECRGDLLARERRGALSDVEGLALRAHLVTCGSCRLAQQVFVDLEDLSGVDLYDGARIERMTRAARRFAAQGTRPTPRQRTRPRKRRLGTLGIAVVTVLLGGTASATVWWWRHAQVGSVPELALDGTTPDGIGPAPRRRAPASSPAAPPANPRGDSGDGDSFPGEATPRSIVSSPAPGRRAMGGARMLSSPARLLRQAGDYRRSGELERATALYRRLQEDFPRSSEAVLSSVALGGVLLERNFPRAALAQFDGYLRSSRGGALIPEALYGRGRAFAALGDREEERRTWDRLLADFPDSAYGPWATRRLANLK